MDTNKIKIRTLIVDDEKLAREKIARLLGDISEIEIVGACENGLEAVSFIERHQPDLVFLDIEMPGLDGFGVLKDISNEVLPVFVFVTAYSEFAVKAFEVNAVDYLLKPFNESRLRLAVDKVKAQIESASPKEREKKILALLEDLKTKDKFAERLVVKDSGRMLLIKTKEVDWIEAAGNYVKLHIGKSAYMLRETMKKLELKLNPKKFVRIHRSTLVNIDRITELQPLFSGDYSILLDDKTELSMSRHYQKSLRKLL